jgi:hypothetical protein
MGLSVAARTGKERRGLLQHFFPSVSANLARPTYLIDDAPPCCSHRGVMPGQPRSRAVRFALCCLFLTSGKFCPTGRFPMYPELLLLGACLTLRHASEVEAALPEWQHHIRVGRNITLAR